ncbi:acyl-CoA thioesterase [Mycolicibacterium bacteremicum]|uniref:4-hydroxybenzoyl-CoA thioesterase n=1 Tax=Mycolicibacterium bacteremicum TaxID=564198 RepID=A0A1W9YNW7_MYCBA|nr:acyl-CoA thioesterase [Mycolicibacterium bacteremicum]MCV7430236.1 acyl-CoA thioesterase [Mycolicibacterium bacteremicum]ORA01758.1 4-hydroxybenzoyl-CoA thioesterase [Mycolicibacterium bacteremicum]
MSQHDQPLVAAPQRPHPGRSAKALYPVTGLALARYGDVDANGHLNNLALESLHENARAEFNERVFPDVYQPAVRTIRLVSASNVVHFLAEVHWPATIETGLGIGRLGRTSYVASTALFVGDTCVSLCDTVLVMLDDDGPTPIPAEAREKLGTYLLG